MRLLERLKQHFPPPEKNEITLVGLYDLLDELENRLHPLWANYHLYLGEIVALWPTEGALGLIGSILDPSGLPAIMILYNRKASSTEAEDVGYAYLERQEKLYPLPLRGMYELLTSQPLNVGLSPKSLMIDECPYVSQVSIWKAQNGEVHQLLIEKSTQNNKFYIHQRKATIAEFSDIIKQKLREYDLYQRVYRPKSASSR